jgi:hypothetical protein
MKAICSSETLIHCHNPEDDNMENNLPPTSNIEPHGMYYTCNQAQKGGTKVNNTTRTAHHYGIH